MKTRYPFSILCLLILSAPAARAQEVSLDSLRQTAAQAAPDTNLVWTYRNLFRALFTAEGLEQEALATAEKGLGLSRKLRFEAGIDLFLFYKATVLDVLGRGREAIPYFEESLAMSQKRGDQPAIADGHINLGVAWYQLGVLDKSLENYLAAFEIYERLQDRERLSKVLNNIGIIYLRQDNLQRAEEIYLKSLAIKQELADSAGMAASYQNLGSVYKELADESKAISSLTSSLELYTALNHPRDVAGCQVSLGTAYFDFGKTAAAKTAVRKALEFYDQQVDPEYTPSALALMGKIFASENQYAEAGAYLERGLALARQYGQRETTLSILQELGPVQEKQGKATEALRYWQQAYALRDTMTEEKRLALLQEMQVRFDVLQKDRDLEISRIKLQEELRQKTYLLVLVALLASLSVVIFISLRNRLRANKKIAAQESEIQQQQIQRLEQENKLSALTHTLAGQETERSRIAKDLHDSLGGILVSVKSHVNALPQPDAEAALLAKTNHLIDEAAGEIRRIAHNMMPRALALSGLSGALEDLAEELSRQGLHTELEIVGMEQTTLDATRSVMIYRIIQELTQNTRKHAQASELFLQLIRQEDQLLIIVEDNGLGFDLEEAKKKKGMGLASIESRVQFLQGAIEWDSRPGEGTTVMMRAPMG